MYSNNNLQVNSSSSWISHQFQKVFRKQNKEKVEEKLMKYSYNGQIDTLTDEQITDFKEAFAHYDKDADGVISTKELATVMRSLGQNPTEAELEDIINEIDINGSGSLEFSEFITLMARHIKNNDDDIEIAFRVFDIKGKGMISAMEIRRIMTNFGGSLSKDEIDEIMHEIDGDGDGLIRYQEFVDALSK